MNAEALVSLVFLAACSLLLALMLLHQLAQGKQQRLRLSWYLLWFCAHGHMKSRVQRQQCRDALEYLGQQLPLHLSAASTRYAAQWLQHAQEQQSDQHQHEQPLLPLVPQVPSVAQMPLPHAYIAPEPSEQRTPITNPRLVAIKLQHTTEAVSPALREAYEGACQEHARRLEQPHLSAEEA